MIVSSGKEFSCVVFLLTFKYKFQFLLNFMLVAFDVVFENDNMKSTESLLLEETKLTKQGVEKYPLGLNKEPIY